MTARPVNTIICLSFIIAGFFVIAGDLFFGYRTFQFTKNAASAEGVVSGLNYGASHPQIKFTAQDGREIQYAQNGLIGGYAVNERVKVLYEPQNPSNACVDSFGALWGFQTLALILGMFLIAAGIFKRLRSGSKNLRWNIETDDEPDKSLAGSSPK